jgi:RNA polymerase sigma-70 factor (ECF subfamily)
VENPEEEKMNVSTLSPGGQPGPLCDDDLVSRVRTGDLAAFEVLMRRHNQRVYRAVRAILRDEAEVEDAMQQAYLLAFTGLAGFAGESAFSTWLLRIAVNEALGRLRRRTRTIPLEEDPMTIEPTAISPDGSPEDQAASREAIRLVESAVDGLSVEHRAVFVLREVEQLTTAETSEALGISEENVKVRLHRARHALRGALYERVGRSASAAFPFFAPRCDRVVAAVMRALAAGLPTRS